MTEKSRPHTQKQASLSKRRASRRPSSFQHQQQQANASAAPAAKEVPWDLFDRLFVPLLGCHAAATVLSFVLNVLRISQVSSFGLFVLFTLLVGGSILFYHQLRVRMPRRCWFVCLCVRCVRAK